MDNKALFMIASSFDKGPEEMTRVSGDTFYSLYGTDIRFSRHGQIAIEAAAIIDAGGELLVKRIVADDATLDNIVFLATLSSSTTQATDDEGNLLYLDSEGNQTTTETEEIVVDSTSTSIKWSAVSIENCYTYDEVVEQAEALLDTDAGVYPLIVIVDNGRGDTGKAVRIYAANEVSTTLNKTFYTLSTYEGTTRTDTTTVTINSTVYDGKNYGLDEYSMTQIKGHSSQAIYSQFIQALADSLGITAEEADMIDIVSCLSYKGVAVDGLTLDADSIDLTVDYGVELSGGDNGEFGISPANTDAWTDALLEFYNGEYSNEIYELDEQKVCFIPDANLPYTVKEAIAALVTFREDCVFLRDTCLDVTSYATAVAAMENFETNNKFITNYCSWYQIYDPYDYRRIKVTMLYDLVKCLVTVYNTGIHVPTAGIANGYILESPIEGTINFIPRITPDVNEKQLMDDLRMNYAFFQNGQCVVQSLYTSQEAYTQLSYMNNVLAIQEVVRSVRTACPKKRYTFVDDGDFSEYAEHVQKILANFSSNFDTLNFIYTKDNIMSNQKIFYASIEFAFKDWAQSEIFDVYAIANTTAESAVEEE